MLGSRRQPALCTRPMPVNRLLHHCGEIDHRKFDAKLSRGEARDVETRRRALDIFAHLISQALERDDDRFGALSFRAPADRQDVLDIPEHRRHRVTQLVCRDRDERVTRVHRLLAPRLDVGAGSAALYGRRRPRPTPCKISLARSVSPSIITDPIDGNGQTPLERVPTGIPGLDSVLRGGFLKAGIYIVRGEPGTGKTIFGNQFSFNHVAAGHCRLSPS